VRFLGDLLQAFRKAFSYLENKGMGPLIQRVPQWMVDKNKIRFKTQQADREIQQ